MERPVCSRRTTVVRPRGAARPARVTKSAATSSRPMMTCRRALSQVSKVRARTLGETRALVGVFGELKCGEDEFTLGACGWDAAKCAFCLRHRVGVGMLLVAAAPATVRAAGGAGVEFLRGRRMGHAGRQALAAPPGSAPWERDGYKPAYVFRRFRTIEVSCTEPFGIGRRRPDRPGRPLGRLRRGARLSTTVHAGRRRGLAAPGLRVLSGRLPAQRPPTRSRPARPPGQT